MSRNTVPQLHILQHPASSQHEMVLELLDQVHTAVSDRDLAVVTSMSKQELVRYLQDVIYTAQETIDELHRQQDEEVSFLRVVK